MLVLLLQLTTGAPCWRAPFTVYGAHGPLARVRGESLYIAGPDGRDWLPGRPLPKHADSAVAYWHGADGQSTTVLLRCRRKEAGHD